MRPLQGMKSIGLVFLLLFIGQVFAATLSVADQARLKNDPVLRSIIERAKRGESVTTAEKIEASPFLKEMAINQLPHTPPQQPPVIDELDTLSLPFTQDFSSTTFPPADWSETTTGSGSYVWVRYAGTPNWAHINWWSNTNYYQRDYLITSAVSMLGITAAEFDFNWSYNGDYTASYDDSLEVAYSVDNGTTWNTMWLESARGTPSLCAGTGAATTAPATSNYGFAQIVLPAGACNQANVRFAFIGHNGYGPDIFVTNVHVFSLLGQATNPVPPDQSTNVATNSLLQWTAGSNAVSYNVKFGTDSTTFPQVITHQNVLTYTPTLASSTTYYWKVTALGDTAGTAFATGPIWRFTTGTGAAPDAPTSGAFVSSTTTTLTGSFTDNATNETGFPITRSTDGFTYSTYYTAAAHEGTGTVSLTDTALSVNTQYWYRIFAQNAAATSINFAAVNGWTLANVPDTASAISSGITSATIAIHGGVNPAYTQFAVLDSNSGNFLQANGTFAAGTAWRTLAQWGATTSITGLISGTNYVIKVKARNGVNVETAYSLSRTFTTSSSYSLPFNEGFVGATFLPADWTSTFVGTGTYRWQRPATGNGSGGVNGSAYFSTYYATPGDVTVLWTPPVSTVGITSGLLSYDWWYSNPYTVGNDSLIVVYSTNGGSTYTPLEVKYGGGTGISNLQTTIDATYYYTGVNTTGWMNSSISLPAAAIGQASIMFGFRVVKGTSWDTGGLGLDNISVVNNVSPRIAFNPATLSFPSVPTNVTTNRITYVKNIGGTTLHVTGVSATTVSHSPSTFNVAVGDSVAVTVSWMPTTATTLTDNVVFTSDGSNGPTNSVGVTGNSIAHTGGPDGFGYRFMTSLVPGGPTFGWVDLSTTGTSLLPVSVREDDYVTAVPLGTFAFPFYGTTVNSTTGLMVSSNGNLQVGTTASVQYNNESYPLPTSQLNAMAICPMYDDWIIDGSVTPPDWIKSQDMGDGRFVVEWHGRHISAATYQGDMEAIIYTNGTIVFQYNNFVDYTYWAGAIGIQGAQSGANFLTFGNNANVPVNGFAVEFYTLGVASNPVPADSALAVPTNASLQWNAGPAAAAYNVFFGTVNPPVTEVLHHHVGLTYTPTLAASTTYYWKVVSLIDTAGTNSVSGPIWRFTTGTGPASNAPTAGAIATDPGPTEHTLTVSWMDNATDETGFPITRSINGTNYSADVTRASHTGTGTIAYTDTGLTVNTHYWYRVYAENGNATSVNYAIADGWTLANVPSAPTVATGITSATVGININGNPAITEYAIFDSSTTQYVQADGTLGASAVWRTAATWGALISVSGLTQNTTYVIKVKARNGVNVETAFSPSTSVTTSNAFSLPFGQSFANGTPWPPADWQNIYPGGATYYWLYTANGNGGANGATYYNMYDAPTNQEAILWTPPISTSGLNACRIDFDWWFSGYPTASTDTFQVVYSLDGGVTYMPFWVRYGNGTGGPSGTDLRTNANTTNYYQQPASTATEWASTTVMVPNEALNVASVRFGWRAKSGATMYTGSSLGLDNIAINATGTGTLTGHVLRATNVAVPGANVHVTNTRNMFWNVTTDEAGSWTVNALADTYSVHISSSCVYPNLNHTGIVLQIDSTVHFDGDTVYAPAASASPTSVDFVVEPGGTASQTIVLTNSGDWTADFNASIVYPTDFGKAKTRTPQLIVKGVNNMSDVVMSLPSKSASPKKVVISLPSQLATSKVMGSFSDGAAGKALKLPLHAGTNPRTSSTDELNTEVIVGTGTVSQVYPFYNYWWYTRDAAIYTAAELGRQGTIDSIGWWSTATGAWTQSTEEMKIYLMHTQLTDFTATTYSTYQSNATLVKTINPFSGPAVTNNWNMYALDTPFQYNGTDNLMVIMEINQSGYTTTYCYSNGTTTTGNMHQYWYQDSSPPTGTGYVTTGRPNLRLQVTTFDYASVSPEQGQVFPAEPMELSVTVAVPDTTPLNTTLFATVLITTNACTTMTIPVTINVQVNAAKELANGLPVEYKLHQNYPNPFNPTTEIRFDLKKAGMTRMTIYNSLGQQVARIVDAYLPAGYHSVRFRSDNLATGVYFYRLESGSFTALKKMVMVK